jgi:hypothetical protein
MTLRQDTAHGIGGEHMKKQEVITGLNSIRYDMEKNNDTYGADIIAEATFRLIHSSIDYE